MTQVHNHCYETVDLDDMVRVGAKFDEQPTSIANNLLCSQITNEFQFSIAAFHHAHETYLVPETLKAAYGRFAYYNDFNIAERILRTPSCHCTVRNKR